mgnify:CR=1 FL=1
MDYRVKPDNDGSRTDLCIVGQRTMKKLRKHFFVVCAIFALFGCSTSSGGDDEVNPQQEEEEPEDGKKTSDEEKVKDDETPVLDSSTYVKFENNSSYAVSVYYQNLPSESASSFAELEEYGSLTKQIAVSAKETTTANFFFVYNIPLGSGSEKYAYFLNPNDSQFRKSQPLYKDRTESNPNEIVIDELNTIDDRLETKSSFLLLKNETTSAIYLLAKDAPINPYGKDDKYIDKKESAFYEIGEGGQLSVESAKSAKVFVNSTQSDKIDFSQIEFGAGKVYTVIVRSESEAEVKPATFFPSSGEVCSVYFENPKNTAENKTVELVQGKSLSEEQLASPQEIPGYSFEGWYLNERMFTTSQSIRSDITLTAKWSLVTYSIAYALNGGNASENPRNYTIESDAITLSNPTCTGYEFKGWYESEDFSGDAVTAIATGSTGDRKFYAKWLPIVYSINYENINGGSAPEITSYTIESDEIILYTPINASLTFINWYSNSDFTGTAVSSVPQGSTGDKTFYALWGYKITYNLNGGTNADENKTLYTEKDSFTLVSPTRPGYKFCGWYETGDFSGKSITQITKESTGNKTFYAKWEPIAYSIAYVLNGGTNASGNPTTYTVEDSVSLENPTRLGQVFLGWYENAIFTGEKITGIALGSTGNKTFYARWDAQSSITVTESALSDISVEKSQSGNIVTFTADAGFPSYKWEVDGTAQATVSRTLQLDTTGWAKGSYEVTLEAKSGGRTRSAIFYIQVEAN